MGDYVLRSAVIDETRKPRLTDAELRRRIWNLPAPDVRPVVHATWETDTCHFYCSDCDYYVDYQTNFCPNCGAYMRGGA